MTPTTTSADADLLFLTAARNGDPAAFEVLFRRHFLPTSRLARWLCGDESRADDITAESFAKVFALIREGRGPCTNFRSYVVSSLRTVWIDELRVASRELSTGDHELLDDVCWDPLSRRSDERSDVLWTAFETLPPRWQHVLCWTVVEGLSTEWVAQELDISRSAAGSLAHRARTGLRRAFEQEVGRRDGRDPLV